MNVVFTIEVQDGMRTRYEYHTKVFEKDLTKEELTAHGDGLIKEYYSDDELANGFYWDTSWETAGRFDTYNVVECENCWKTICNII